MIECISCTNKFKEDELAEHISEVHGSSTASAKDTALALIVNSNIMTDILNETFFFNVMSVQKNFNIKLNLNSTKTSNI